MNVCSDGAEVMCGGSLFQTREAATWNALSPTVDRRIAGTTSADVDDDLRRRRELMSATRRITSERYAGARSCSVVTIEREHKTFSYSCYSKTNLLVAIMSAIR